MKDTKISRVFILFSFFSLFNFSLTGENFRVAQMKSFDFSQGYDPIVATVGVNEGIYIKIPEDKTFIEGFEIEIKIPKIIATYRDSVIYSFFSNLTPEPKASLIDYSGTKLFIDTIPNRLSINLQAFFENSTQAKPSPYSTLLPFKIEKNHESLALRFQLAMKGLPESFFTSEFTVTIKPILKNEGLLELNLIYPNTESVINLDSKEAEKIESEINDQQILVYIDDNLIEEYNQPILLKTGMHHISVISENYRNEVRTVIINQGVRTSLDIELKSINPELSIVAPENTKIFLDDAEITDIQSKIPISPGEHTVKFIVGDYELIKSITISNGKSYVVSLFVDIKLEEQNN